MDAADDHEEIISLTGVSSKIPTIAWYLCLGLLIMIVTNLRIDNVEAQTIIVAQDGSGDHRSIQDAVNVSEEGDTIRAWERTYNENGIVNITVNLEGNGEPKKENSSHIDFLILTTLILFATIISLGGLYYMYCLEKALRRLHEEEEQVEEEKRAKEAYKAFLQDHRMWRPVK